jgi:hypothetical protein
MRPDFAAVICSMLSLDPFAPLNLCMTAKKEVFYDAWACDIMSAARSIAPVAGVTGFLFAP